MLCNIQGMSNNQEEQAASFLRAYFGPIGQRENSPEIVVIQSPVMVAGGMLSVLEGKILCLDLKREQPFNNHE